MGKVPNDFIPSLAFQLGNLFQLRCVYPEEDVYAFSSEDVNFFLSICVLRETLLLSIVRCRRDVLRWEMLKPRRGVHRQGVREREITLPDQENLIRRSERNRRRFPSGLLLGRIGLFARLDGLSDLSLLFEAGLLVKQGHLE